MEKIVYRPARIKDWHLRLNRIEKLRDKGLTLAEACEKMGVARSTHWEWVRRFQAWMKSGKRSINQLEKGWKE